MSTTTLQITVPTKAAKRNYIAIEEGQFVQMQKRLSELEQALHVITRGDKEYRQQKTRKVKSLADLV